MADSDSGEFADLYEPLEKWGFFPTLKRLCNGDITKRDEILNTECGVIYTWLTVDAVESKIEKAINKRISSRTK